MLTWKEAKAMRSEGTKHHFDNLYFDEPRQYEGIRVFQIGDIYCNSDHQIGFHQQRCHEISYIVSGNGIFHLDGKDYEVKGGDLFLAPLGSVHSITSSHNSPIRFYYVGFLFEKEHPDYPKYEPLDQKIFNHPFPIAVDQYSLPPYFIGLFNEIILDCDNQTTMIGHYLNLILLLTERDFWGKDNLRQKIGKDARGKSRLVYDIIHYMENHIFQLHSIQDISRYVGYSYSYVAQVFSSEMGMSLSNYHQQIRFEKAIELMKTNITITQISEMLGFESIHAFSRAFKRIYNCSPSRYLLDQKKSSDAIE